MQISRPDEYWMKIALSLARSAQSLGEIPVGALVVIDNQLISTGFNLREYSFCATKHAEIIAIEKACAAIKNWRLQNANLYVTLEPCLMCAGAILNSRVKKVFYATEDPKGGALGSLYQVSNDTRLNHSFEVSRGLCELQANMLLKDFFKNLRKKTSNLTVKSSE